MRYVKELDVSEPNWRRKIRKILKGRDVLWWNIVEDNCESFKVFSEYLGRFCTK